MKPSPEALAASVDAIVFDVDGVLTPGTLLYGPDGECKVFHVHDGHAFHFGRSAGLRFGMLTGRRSEAVRRRAAELSVDALEEGSADKGAALPLMLDRLMVKPERACYVGDDLVDVPAMRKVAFPVAVANAVEEVKDAASWVTQRAGGEGAAREVIEFVLKSRNLWNQVLARYFD